MSSNSGEASRIALAERVRICLADADALALPLVAAHLDTALTALALPEAPARACSTSRVTALH